MRILALDAALGACSAGVSVDGAVSSLARRAAAPGQAAALALLAQAALDEAGCGAADLDAIAVTVGPGGFTGIRAALALAHGIALAAGVPVVGVSVGEALAAVLSLPPGWGLWCAIDSRRGQVFLERGGNVTAVELDALPHPASPVALAGDAAAAVAARLAARGEAVMLTDARLPGVRGVAAAATARLAGRLAPREAVPLYVDPPAARLPAGGLRPPPAGVALPGVR